MAAIFCCRVIEATLAEMASAAADEKPSRPLGAEVAGARAGWPAARSRAAGEGTRWGRGAAPEGMLPVLEANSSSPEGGGPRPGPLVLVRRACGVRAKRFDSERPVALSHPAKERVTRSPEVRVLPPSR